MTVSVPIFVDEPDLQAECRRAVLDSRKEIEDLSRAVNALIDSLSSTRAPSTDVPAELAEHNRKITEKLVHDLSDAVGQRFRHQGTFNVTLFGRTGTGKSSLIEALTYGDGTSISPGYSDWTVEPSPTVWGSFRITDVPGTEGWGRSEDTARLREIALSEVACSDLVVLCFDSQNQRVAEFRTVANWIAEFGKPAVAVLNIRNRIWRFPPRAGTAKIRSGLSRTVREHADEIAECLAEIGLAGTPVVALSAKDAAFARVPEGRYAGHDMEGYQTRLAQAGSAAQLLEWSNLNVLESLITEIVRTHAVDLRLSAVREHVRTAARRAGQASRQAGAYLADMADQVELGIQRVLAALGAPETLPDAADATGRREVSELLAQVRLLESLRGGRFPAPPRGSALRYFDQLVVGRVGPLRAAALERAEMLIDRAMDRQRKVSADEFSREVFRDDEVGGIIDGIREDFAEHVRNQLGHIAQDVHSDVVYVSGRLAGVHGGRGRARRLTGAAAGLGGALALSFAGISNFWNPVGWGALGAVAITVGERSRKGAAARRERELSQTRSEARRTVNKTFDQLEADLRADATTAAKRLLIPPLRDAVAQAIELREIAAGHDESREKAAALQCQVPAASSPQAAISQAVTACERAAGTGRTTNQLWLGESWIGARDGAKETSLGPGAWTRGEVAERTLAALTGTGPVPGSGRAWMRKYREALARDPQAAMVVRQLDRLAMEQKPYLVFCGDYSSGKTSLIARLHRDEGQAVPDTLKVGGHPTTARAVSYPWCGYLLVDTPGFQSRHTRHVVEALDAIAAATAIVYMFTPTTISGDFGELRTVLDGVQTAKVLLVISRADELGVDPQDSPRGFGALCALKESELLDALQRTVDPAADWPAAISIAPSPYGGASESAPWDGVTEFAHALRELQGNLGAVAVDCAVLGTAMRRLTALAEQAEDTEASMCPGIEQLSRLQREAAAAANEVQALADERHAALERITADFLETLISRVLSSRDRNKRAAVLNRAASFASDSDLAALTEEWEQVTRARVISTINDTSASLDRRRGAASFTGPVATHEPREPLSLPGLRGARKKSASASAATRAANLLSKMDVYSGDLSESAATLVSRAGPVLAIAGAAISAWDVLDDLRNRERNERKRSEDIEKLHRSGRDHVRARCDDDPALIELGQYQSELTGLAAETAARLAEAEQELAELDSRARLYRAAADAAARSARGEPL